MPCFLPADHRGGCALYPSRCRPWALIVEEGTTSCYASFGYRAQCKGAPILPRNRFKDCTDSVTESPLLALISLSLSPPLSLYICLSRALLALNISLCSLSLDFCPCQQLACLQKFIPLTSNLLRPRRCPFPAFAGHAFQASPASP